MSDLVQVELTEEQRKTIVRGLRYVRSSGMLNTSFPSDEKIEKQRVERKQVEALIDLISSAPSVSAAEV